MLLSPPKPPHSVLVCIIRYYPGNSFFAMTKRLFMQNAVLFSKTATQNGMEQTLGILRQIFQS